MSISPELESKINATIQVLNDIQNTDQPATFANSFGAEDMVLTDLIRNHTPEIGIFSLDTGRLPEETYAVMEKTVAKYGPCISVYFPDPADLEPFLNEHGPNAFYQSVELRKQCCKIRKVMPLKRALKDKKAWITGLRREQAVTRTSLPVSEWDEGNGLQKYNPLTDWSEEDVWNYIKHHDIPYNELHDKNYPSIGCAPCTRAITKGEDVRAGRWWWEDPDSKECGLHVK